MPEDKLDSVANLSKIDAEYDHILKRFEALRTTLAKGLEISIFGANSASGMASVQQQAVQAVNTAKAAQKDYIEWWKNALREKDAIEKASRAAEIQGARERLAVQKEVDRQNLEEKKRIAAEERELNRLIAAEEKVLLAQNRAERKVAIAERKQADREYQNTWVALLKERDDMERQAAMQRKKEAAEAAMRVSSDSVAGMSKTLNDLRYGWDRLTKAERDNAEIGGVLLARIKQLDTELKATDAATGRFARNVGNYTNAVTPLQRQLALIGSELPNMQYGFRTFASSFSNQISGVMEAIRQTIAQNKALRAEGKETISLARQLATGFLTWQTAILTLAGVLPILIERLFSAKQETKELTEQSKDYAESQKKVAEAIGREVSEMNVLLAKASDTARSYKERGTAVDDLQKKFPEYFAALSREAILNGDVAAAVDLATAAIVRRAREAQRIEKYTKAVTELAAKEEELNAIQNPGKGNFVYDNGRAAALQNEIAMQRKKVEQLGKTLLLQEDVNADEAYWLDSNAKKRYDDNKQREKTNALLTEEERKVRDRLAKLKPKADKFTAEKEAIEAQKRISENEKMAYDQRYAAAVQFSKLSDQLLIKQNKHSIDNITIYADEASKLFDKIEEDKKKAQEEELKRIQEISKREYEYIVKNLNDIAAAGKESGLNDKQIYQNQLSYLEQSLQAVGLNEEEINKIKEKATDYRIKLLELEERAKDKIRRQELDAERKLQSQRKQLERELVDFTLTMIEASFSRRINTLEKEQEESDKYYDKRREAIESSSKTDKEKSDLRMQLNADEEAQRQRIDAEMAEEKRKQALLSKGIAISGIAIKLAETITAINLAAAQYNAIVPGSGIAYAAAAIPLAIATAAAQTAVVAAQPIPEYEKGKKKTDSYEGLAWISEHGQKEARIKPDGTTEMYSEPTLIYTQRGDRILSNPELKAIENRASKGDTVSIHDYHELIRSNAAMLKEQKRSDKGNADRIIEAVYSTAKMNKFNYLREKARA